TLLLALALGERDDLLERGHLELAVELLRPVGEVLHAAQPLDLGQREVGGEESSVGRAVDDDGATARSELRPARHVGGCDQVRLVAGDEVAVFGRHQVRLDEVGAELNGEGVALQRVRRQIAMRPAMTDDERLAEIAIVAGARIRRTKSQDCRGEREAARKIPHFHLILPPTVVDCSAHIRVRSDARMTYSLPRSVATACSIALLRKRLESIENRNDTRLSDDC